MPEQLPPSVGDMRYITLEGYSKMYISKRVLCNHCGKIGFCGSEFAKRVEFAKETFKRCDEFMPVLKFQSLKGTDAGFNTFRLGKAWSQRLTPGIKVALLNARSKQIVGSAEVVALHVGEKHEMELAHGSNNHLMLNRIDIQKGDFSPLMRRSYGGLIYDNNRFATVIYLNRRV